MAITYGKKKIRHSSIFTVIVALIISCIFLSVVRYFYIKAEEEAYEQLHLQTKQIKDDLQLQLISDRENLITMANFAAKLYSDGESYDRMFRSFKPIGLIGNIGILTPDNVFLTKTGNIDLSGKISYYDEAKIGEYISDRVSDLTGDYKELVRTAVPIRVGNKSVGMLYGVIRLEDINTRYRAMAEELDAQLFVYNKKSGKLIIDTLHEYPDNITMLKDREYKDGFTYEDIIGNDKGYSSFRSKYTGEIQYVHYSNLDRITDWHIMLVRAESKVFEKTKEITKVLTVSFLLMAGVIVFYLGILLNNEKRRRLLTAYVSKARRLLLEINQQTENISDVLNNILIFAKSRSSFFVDTDGEEYSYILPQLKGKALSLEDRKKLCSELFYYSAELHRANNATVSVVRIIPNKHLKKTNNSFYQLLKNNNISDVSFASVTAKNNHISILGVLNPKKGNDVRKLLEEIAVCFSIAIYNKNHLNMTEIAAVTDSLTGVSNRVSYKKDLAVFSKGKNIRFSCIYVDVNELHMRNNKYGHAAGDEMLIYVANTLKDVFYGHKIYRMGGDEFLVFVQDTEEKNVNECIEIFIKQLEPKDYHVAVGVSYREESSDVEEMVREAEVKMYEAKASYYQSKEMAFASNFRDNEYIVSRTGNEEVDKIFTVLNEHYYGIYLVSLDSNDVRRILMPAYLGYDEYEKDFSELLKRYIDESVHSNYRRAIISFINYDAIRSKLSENKVPRITFKKVTGESVVLSIYRFKDSKNKYNTLWVFARE